MAPLKVLSIDDDLSVRTFVRVALETAGFEVTALASGEEALALLDTGYEPDVILLDLLMPGMDGNEVRAALGKRPGKQAPIVVYTGYAQDVLLGGGLVAILSKPSTAQELVAKVREALRLPQEESA